MKRHLIALATAAALTAIGAAQDATDLTISPPGGNPAPMSADLKSCIETNAAKVERIGEPISASLEILVAKVCAAEVAAISAATQAASRQKQKDAMKTACERMKARANTDEARQAAEQCDIYESFEPGSYLILESYSLSNAPADAIALAANLIIELRTQRLDAKPQ